MLGFVSVFFFIEKNFRIQKGENRKFTLFYFFLRISLDIQADQHSFFSLPLLSFYLVLYFPTTQVYSVPQNKIYLTMVFLLTVWNLALPLLNINVDS